MARQRGFRLSLKKKPCRRNRGDMKRWMAHVVVTYYYLDSTHGRIRYKDLANGIIRKDNAHSICILSISEIWTSN